MEDRVGLFQRLIMAGFPSPFGGADEPSFDEYEEYVPSHLPSPGEFLSGHDVLTGEDHVEFHNLTRTLFEERTVYDMTFNYNLARLNLDTRHPEAGFRYAESVHTPSVLRAEFTPTTPFCPQTETLTVGAFRAWNELNDRHSYDMVRVQAAAMHHRSDVINDRLTELETQFQDTGELSTESNAQTASVAEITRSPDAPF